MYEVDVSGFTPNEMEKLKRDIRGLFVHCLTECLNLDVVSEFIKINTLQGFKHSID